jgi:hypothetical protein
LSSPAFVILRIPHSSGWGEKRSFLLLFAAVWCVLAAPIVRAQTAREHEVKATLLFNFCHFVEWPARAFSNDSAPFVIGILGRDPFGRFLDELVKGEKTHGRPIEVRRFGRIEEITEVHLLYVSASEQGRVRGNIALLKGRPLLTVGEDEDPGFARWGGMVEFTRERGNLKLRINLDEARKAGLVISAKLLRLSEVARTQN